MDEDEDLDDIDADLARLSDFDGDSTGDELRDMLSKKYVTLMATSFRLDSVHILAIFITESQSFCSSNSFVLSSRSFPLQDMTASDEYLTRL